MNTFETFAKMNTFPFVWIFVFIGITNLSNVHGIEQTSDASLAKWFETVLELSANVSTSDGGSSEKKERHPYYVQELYDMLTEDAETDAKRRYDWNNDKSLTIQAIPEERNSAHNAENGIVLKFLMNKLWVKKDDLARAKLVLTCHRELLSPKYSYKVTLDYDFDDTGERRFSVVEKLKRISSEDDDNDRLFVELPVTTAVRSILENSDVRNTNSEALVVRINVEEIHENGRVQKVRPNVVRQLFHTNTDGRSRPILVLFSSNVKSMAHNDRRRKRRRFRRSTYDDTPSEHGVNCGLRRWHVKLRDYLGQHIIKPEMAMINFCSGVCPFPAFDSHWNATINAVVRNAFIAARSDRHAHTNVPDATCVPHSLLPLSIFYHDENNFIVKILDQVVATSCMCA